MEWLPPSTMRACTRPGRHRNVDARAGLLEVALIVAGLLCILLAGVTRWALAPALVLPALALYLQHEDPRTQRGRGGARRR